MGRTFAFLPELGGLVQKPDDYQNRQEKGCMILQKRKIAAAAWSQGLPETSLRYRLVQKWHHFAVFAVMVLLASAIINMILGTASGQATLTLLMVPFYFLLDWILCRMLEAAFGIAAQPALAEASSAGSEGDGHEGDGESEAAPPVTGKISKDKSAHIGRLDLDHMKGPLRTALRLALAAFLFFWTLKIWDIDFSIGETLAKISLNVLLVVLICYVAWGIINAAILRRMRREMQEAFKEEGIDFAHRNVTVYIPPEVQKAMTHADGDSRQKMILSSAAGPLAAIQAEEEAEQAAQQPKEK